MEEGCKRCQRRQYKKDLSAVFGFYRGRAVGKNVSASGRSTLSFRDGPVGVLRLTQGTSIQPCSIAPQE